MSMDAVFCPEKRKWMSPVINLEKRMLEMERVRAEFLGPVELLWNRKKLEREAKGLPLNPEDDEDPTPVMSEEAKAEDKLRRERIFGKPVDKNVRRGPKGKQPANELVEAGEKADDEIDMSALFEDDDEEPIPSDPEDHINMQYSSDENNKDEDNPLRHFDSSEDESGGETTTDEEKNRTRDGEDSDGSDEAFRKLMEKTQPNAAALAEQDEKNFALHYKYAKLFAKQLDTRQQEKEKKDIQLYFGDDIDDEKFKALWRASSPHLATTKAEVIVDDAIFKNTEMPLLAGAIPPHAVKKLSSLSIYTMLSDEPGNFQWRMVNVVDQLTNDLKFSKQNFRSRQLGELGPHDKVSNEEVDGVLTVTMYQTYETAEGDYFYDLKTSQEPKVGLIIEILASQTLEDLVKKLLCQSDFMCTTDMAATFSSENSDEILRLLEPDLSGTQYPSRILFVNDTLYTEGGTDSLEYRKKLNAWVKQAPKKEIGEFKLGSLKNTKLRDLNLRFGFPYVYIHQANCEHIIVFNGMRSIRRVEYAEFPRFERIGKYPTKYCRVDNESLARWAVVGYDRMPEDPMLLCTDCVNHYCFNGTERIGEFKLFPFLQFLHYA